MPGAAVGILADGKAAQGPSTAGEERAGGLVAGLGYLCPPELSSDRRSCGTPAAACACCTAQQRGLQLPHLHRVCSQVSMLFEFPCCTAGSFLPQCAAPALLCSPLHVKRPRNPICWGWHGGRNIQSRDQQDACLQQVDPLLPCAVLGHLCRLQRNRQTFRSRTRTRSKVPERGMAHPESFLGDTEALF